MSLTRRAVTVAAVLMSILLVIVVDEDSELVPEEQYDVVVE